MTEHASIFGQLHTGVASLHLGYRAYNQSLITSPNTSSK